MSTSDRDSLREAIIRSLFSTQLGDGSLEERYVSHLVIHETSFGTNDVKERFLLLSIDNKRQGLVHKAKENSNGTFSIGKTWKLSTLQAVEARTNPQQPTSFSLKFARRYTWTTLDEREQAEFLGAVIDSFRRVTGGQPLSIVGVGGQQSPASGGQDRQISSPLRPSASLAIRPGMGMDRQASQGSYTSAYAASVSPTEGSNTPVYAPTMYGPTSARQQARPPPSSSLRAESPALPPTAGSRRAMTPQQPLVAPPSVSTASSRTPTPTVSVPDIRAPSPAKQPEQRPALRQKASVAQTTAFDPANQARLERLLSLDVQEEGAGLLPTGDTEATLAHAEELLDGYDWTNPPTSAGGEGKKRGGMADIMQARLMDELLALEKSNVHFFVESDDRIQAVMSFLDDAILELEDMEMMVQSYKVQLNGVSDDISFIQSQSRRPRL